MIKAVKIKDVINRESLGEKQRVIFNTIVGENEEGHARDSSGGSEYPLL